MSKVRSTHLRPVRALAVVGPHRAPRGLLRLAHLLHQPELLGPQAPQRRLAARLLGRELRVEQLRGHAGLRELLAQLPAGVAAASLIIDIISYVMSYIIMYCYTNVYIIMIYETVQYIYHS